MITVIAFVFSLMPFAGAGVNTHGQLLPLDKLRAIGIGWVRADVPVSENSEDRFRQVLGHYKGMPVVWTLSQKDPHPDRTARLLVKCGCKDIEVFNEVDLSAFNPEKRPWTPREYAKRFAVVRKAVGKSARLYGPATSTWMPSFIGTAIHYGMQADGISFHGYGVPELSAAAAETESRWKLPVLITEDAVLDGSSSAFWFLSRSMEMGRRPWCFYDGPATDARGLFGWSSGYTWDRPTAVYGAILSAVTPAN